MMLHDKLERINILKDELRLKLSNEQLHQAEKKLQVDFHYNSNGIFGSALSYNETQLAISYDTVVAGRSVREYTNLQLGKIAYQSVLDAAYNKRHQLNVNFIDDIHRILSPRKHSCIAPANNNFVNAVVSGGDINYFDRGFSRDLYDIAAWYKDEQIKNELYAPELAALLHKKIIETDIEDAHNGKLARMLVNYVLIKNDLLPVAFKPTETINYIEATANEDITVFSNYLADQLLLSHQCYLDIISNEKKEETRDWRKKIVSLKQELDKKDQIRFAKNHSIIRRIYNGILLPLIFRIKDEISEYENLFLSNAIFFKTSKESFYNQLRNISQIDAHIAGNIVLYTDDIAFDFSFNDFKIIEYVSFDIHCKLSVSFLKHSYELTFEDKTISKYYHQVFSEEDIQMLIDHIGSVLHSELKKCMIANKRIN